MEIVPSNSENVDRPRVRRGRKRKNTTLNETNSSSSSNLEPPLPRAIGLDGHFYECVKCNEVGSLICCDNCACTYHYECLDPPLESVPEGDWFCHNCSEEVENLSDSTVNPRRRRGRSLKRACKVPSGCCLCLTINKTLIPYENEVFSFKTKSSTPQSNLSNRGEPSARNHDGDKRSVLRLRRRADKIETRKTGKNTRARAAQAEKVQKSVNNLPPRRKGRPPGKRTGKGPSVAPQRQNEQQQQHNQTQPGLAMVLYGQNPSPQELAARRAAAEAARRNKAKETPWTEDEVDALWVGVRRHGPNNWGPILNDENLRVLKLRKKTSQDLSMRWQKELEIMYSIVKTSGFFLPPPAAADQPAVDHTPVEPAILSNEEATVQQQLSAALQIPVISSAESAPLVANNNHHGSSSSSSSPLRAPAPLIPPAAGEAERGPINQSTSHQLQHVLAPAGIPVASPEIPVPRARVSFAAAAAPPPPQWRPNLNLNPIVNHLMFQAFQRTQMMNPMGVQAPRAVAMSAQRPPAANTIVPPTNLFIGGFFPVHHAHGTRPNNPAVRNPYSGGDR